MLLLNTIKQGDTFTVVLTVKSDTPVLTSDLRAQVRDASGTLMGNCIIAKTGDNQFQLSIADTTTWTGKLYMDIRRTSSGFNVSTETMEIPVKRPITQ